VCVCVYIYSRSIVYPGYEIRYCIPEPTCRTRPDSTCVCFSFHSVFFTDRRFFPTSPSPSSQIDHAPPTILRTGPPAGETDPRSIRPPAGDPPVMRRAPPSPEPFSLAGSCLTPATPCAALRRRLPSAGFPSVTLGLPPRRAAWPAPLPTRRGTLSWSPISRFGPSPATLW